MKSKIGVIFIITGAVLIASALSLVFYNIHTDKSAEDYSLKILEELEHQIPELENPFDEINSVDNQLVPDKDMKLLTADGHNYIGILHIPSLDIKLPVMNKWDYDNLKLAPCRYSGNINENSMIIAGHNYSSHFGKLKQLKENDDIYFIDANGNVYAYKVSEIEILSGNDTGKMNSGDWSLTLFTCTLSGTERVTVRCDLSK
ncbi:sortase [Porcipelethomonas sp.]|uniref:sortase n=1 Tax=Porcipelethomonas sp. TaxID=2981675 RepID=UPI003EF3C244